MKRYDSRPANRNRPRQEKPGHIILSCFLAGIPPRTELQARTLLKRGVPVLLLAWAGNTSGRDIPEAQYIEITTPVGSSARSVGLRRPAVILEYFEFLLRSSICLLCRATPGVGIQVSHPLQLPLTPLLRRRGARVYYDVFEFYQATFSSQGRLGRVAASACSWLEARYVPAVDGVLCVTSQESWLKNRMTSLNPRTIELANYPSTVESALKRGAKPRRRLPTGVIAYVGGLKHGKGLEVFAEVMRRVVDVLPGARFLIVGTIAAPGGAEVWLSTADPEHRCTYVPWTSPSNVQQLLSGADVGLVLTQPDDPRHHLVAAGNGRKIFTYMASGVPIVGPNFSPAWALLSERRLGLQVDTTNAQEIANAVVRLIQDDTMWRYMSQSARKAFERNFNWETQEQKLLTLYGIVDEPNWT